MDTWVLSSLVNGRDDRSLTGLLARVSAAANQVVLMPHAADDATIDDHTAVDALVDMVTTGVPTRSTAQIKALAGAFGATRSAPLGWGFALQVVCLAITATDDAAGPTDSEDPAA